MYQEFANSRSDIAVDVGTTVHVGTFLGTRVTNHIHVGINTKKNPLEANPWTYDGWVDPWQTITDNKIGDDDDGSPDDDEGSDSKTTNIIMMNTYWR